MIKLQARDGKVVAEIPISKEGIPQPYIMFGKRLFVISRDDSTLYFERCYSEIVEVRKDGESTERH